MNNMQSPKKGGEYMMVKSRSQFALEWAMGEGALKAVTHHTKIYF